MDDKFSAGQDKSATLKRRDFLKYSITAAGGAALITSMPPGMGSLAHAAGGGGLETTKVKLGFIALTDAAPLFVADERAFSANTG